MFGVILLTGHQRDAVGHGGGGDGCTRMPLVGRLEDCDVFIVSLGTNQFVAVEEFVPFAFACFGEGFGGGEGFHEGPRIAPGPGVVAVGLVAAGSLALAVAFGVQWIDGLDCHTAVEELFDGSTGSGFDGHAEAGKSGDRLLPLSPAGESVLDAEFGGDCTLSVHHDDVVMVFGPVETGEVSQFAVGCHGLGWLGFPAEAPRPATGRADTMSFASLCSIRPGGVGRTPFRRLMSE